MAAIRDFDGMDSAEGAAPQPGQDHEKSQAFLQSAFGRQLRSKFGADTAVGVMNAFEDLRLPLPDDDTSYLDASDGVVIFLDRYGIVLRIEEATGTYGDYINDSAWVMRPIATLHAGKALIEICPGCETAKEKGLAHALHKRLQEEDILLWDIQDDNVGYLPVKMISFPKGIPVVIDRLSVKRLSAGAAQASRLIKKKPPEAVLKAEAAYYRPFVESFRAAWPLNRRRPASPEKMAAFWSLCQQQAAAGQLITGWQDISHAESSKARTVHKIARRYDRLFGESG